MRSQKEFLTVGIPNSFYAKYGNALFLACLVFLAPLVIDLVWVGAILVERHVQEQRHLDIHNECQRELVSIQSSFTALEAQAYGPRDLFLTHFQRKLRELASRMRGVADTRQLHVEAEHFLNVSNVLDAFAGDEERIWRYTWPIEQPNQRLFEELAWRHYFEQTIKMVGDGSIREIRALLALSDLSHMQHPRIVALRRFFQHTKGVECAVVLLDEYQRICLGSGIPQGVIDFGIYGRRLLFMTETYHPAIAGVFTKDVHMIERYREVFDTMWTSVSISRRAIITDKVEISME